MDNLYEKVCKDSLYCSDQKHAMTFSDIDNAMKKMKRGLHKVMVMMVLPLTI